MYFNKKEEILDIVKGLFSQKGCMLSMSDIAECVKIGSGAKMFFV